MVYIGPQNPEARRMGPNQLKKKALVALIGPDKIGGGIRL